MTSAAEFDIQGRRVGFPIVVRQARMANAVYTVPVEAVRAVLDDPSVEVIEDVHGAATVVIGVVDYEDNDLGDYEEIMWSTMVRSAGDPSVEGTYIWRLPVNQEFTREAGVRMLGLPKTLEDIDVTYDDHGVTATLTHGGELVARQRFPSLADADPTPMPTPTICLSTIDDVPSVSESHAEGNLRMAFAADGYELTIGTGPWADELRTLGLEGATPTVVTVCDDWRASFATPRPVAAG